MHCLRFFSTTTHRIHSIRPPIDSPQESRSNEPRCAGFGGAVGEEQGPRSRNKITRYLDIEWTKTHAGRLFRKAASAAFRRYPSRANPSSRYGASPSSLVCSPFSPLFRHLCQFLADPFRFGIDSGLLSTRFHVVQSASDELSSFSRYGELRTSAAAR